MEELRAQLNACIASIDLQAFPSASNAHRPPPKIFIVGLPHCGTTLAGQLLASVSAFSYISNIIANFWMAPVLGAMVERSLGFSQEDFVSTFDSTHGATEGLTEPHEFGYFWNRWFELGQDTHMLPRALAENFDRTGLRQSVNELACFMGRPLVFKNPTWCDFHIPMLHDIFPDAVFVYCRRDHEFCAQSLLSSRLRRYGDRNSWWSIRPPNYAELKDLHWSEQIAGQIYYSEQEITRGLSALPDKRLVVADLESVRNHPASLVEDVYRALSEQFELPDLNLQRLPDTLSSRDSKRVDDNDWKQLIRALERNYSLASDAGDQPPSSGPA